MTQEEERDIEKTYSHRDFAAKLRRLADALEAGEPFEIRVAGQVEAVGGKVRKFKPGDEVGGVPVRANRRSAPLRGNRA
jgi:NADPH:quinone reductase-like Zn-dependent oxidoreductase